ncbi:hypothetical protein [Salmonirosea aquatica]|uniref:Uncharacterized protein n=1 Tax=Salmonirosea aquatica TaxID=2654236 RepID=A0A7C9FX57_9BACT|nr:hypothetical protein [Cytophagaceae bacterium SJW1-29]
MPDISKKNRESPKIRNNPKIKLLKKNARQRSLLENLESDNTYQDLEEIMAGISEDTLLTEDKSVYHLKGKYERYWLDRTKNILHKDILIIQPNGNVVIRSPRNIYHGEAYYFLNSQLQLDIYLQNDELRIGLTLLGYVGRHDIKDIRCIHVLSLSSDPDLNPVVNYEILVPALQLDVITLPQLIEVDSLEFMKLTHRYPELYPGLQRRHTSAPARVDW